MKNTLYVCLLILFCACNKDVSKENGIESYGNYELQFIDSITYELPETFRPNSPFTKVFFDHATKKEYVTFGNDYTTDSVYFFELTKGGKHRQATSFGMINNGRVRGIEVVSIDSIWVIPKKTMACYLIDKKGRVYYSNHSNKNAKHKNINVDGPAKIQYSKTNQKLFYPIIETTADPTNPNYLDYLKSFMNETRINPTILETNFIDTLKTRLLFTRFFSRFIKKNHSFSYKSFYFLKDTRLFCTNFYSDSLYWINHTLEKPIIHAVSIKSDFFDTIRCTPDSMKSLESILAVSFAASSYINNSLSAIHHLTNQNTYLINISRKAIELNESGNGSKFSEYGGLIVLDENLNKQAEFKLKNKYCAFTNDSLVFLGVIPDKTSPTYDPKKLRYEMYKMVPASK